MLLSPGVLSGITMSYSLPEVQLQSQGQYQTESAWEPGPSYFCATEQATPLPRRRQVRKAHLVFC